MLYVLSQDGTCEHPGVHQGSVDKHTWPSLLPSSREHWPGMRSAEPQQHALQGRQPGCTGRRPCSADMHSDLTTVALGEEMLRGLTQCGWGLHPICVAGLL